MSASSPVTDPDVARAAEKLGADLMEQAAREKNAKRREKNAKRLLHYEKLMQIESRDDFDSDNNPTGKTKADSAGGAKKKKKKAKK